MIPSNGGVGHPQSIEEDIPIDPALYAIEQIVNDARKNKERLVREEETRRAVAHIPIPVAEEEEEEAMNHGGEDTGMGMLDDEFDPALREIVNSLTNAQQVCHCLMSRSTADGSRPIFWALISPLLKRKQLSMLTYMMNMIMVWASSRLQISNVGVMVCLLCRTARHS
jgi:hypothetical protein